MPKKKVTNKSTRKAKLSDPRLLAFKRRKVLLDNITPAENHIRMLLKQLNYSFSIQYIVFTSRFQFYILDFYLPKYNICIELDGRHHYESPLQVQHDSIRDISLLKNSIKTIRLANSDGLLLTTESLNQIILDIIDK